MSKSRGHCYVVLLLTCFFISLLLADNPTSADYTCDSCKEIIPSFKRDPHSSLCINKCSSDSWLVPECIYICSKLASHIYEGDPCAFVGLCYPKSNELSFQQQEPIRKMNEQIDYLYLLVDKLNATLTRLSGQCSKNLNQNYVNEDREKESKFRRPEEPVPLEGNNNLPPWEKPDYSTRHFFFMDYLIYIHWFPYFISFGIFGLIFFFFDKNLKSFHQSQTSASLKELITDLMEAFYATVGILLSLLLSVDLVYGFVGYFQTMEKFIIQYQITSISSTRLAIFFGYMIAFTTWRIFKTLQSWPSGPLYIRVQTLQALISLVIAITTSTTSFFHVAFLLLLVSFPTWIHGLFKLLLWLLSDFITIENQHRHQDHQIHNHSPPNTLLDNLVRFVTAIYTGYLYLMARMKWNYLGYCSWPSLVLGFFSFVFVVVTFYYPFKQPAAAAVNSSQVSITPNSTHPSKY